MRIVGRVALGDYQAMSPEVMRQAFQEFVDDGGGISINGTLYPAIVVDDPNGVPLLQAEIPDNAVSYDYSVVTDKGLGVSFSMVPTFGTWKSRKDQDAEELPVPRGLLRAVLLDLTTMVNLTLQPDVAQHKRDLETILDPRTPTWRERKDIPHVSKAARGERE